MVVAGVMSGTSADGIDVALVRMKARSALKVGIARAGAAYDVSQRKVRTAVLATMNASQASVADLARLNFLLGELYSDAVLAAERQFRVKVDLVGCHGQTLYHQGEPQVFLGRKLSSDMADGRRRPSLRRGWAYRWFRIFVPRTWRRAAKARRWFLFSTTCSFAIRRLDALCRTWAGSRISRRFRRARAPTHVFAFDTGPGNMVIDAVTETLFGETVFDRGGKIAASGKSSNAVSWT